MLDKIKEFNEKNNAIYFFAAIIFLVVALLFNGRSNNTNKDKEDNNDTVIEEKEEVSSNYTYDIKINKNEEIVLFTIKVFNNKYLLTKTELGKEQNYYVNYIDIYEQDALGNYILFRGNNFVEGIDNKLLFWDYLEDIIDKSTKIEDTKTCLKNDEYNFTICPTSDGYDITSDAYNINYRKYDVDTTKDFNISLNTTNIN